MNKETRQKFFSSENQKWCTPQNFFDRLNEVFNFKLDPCCVPETAKCKIYFTPKEDGLKQEWNKIGNAFVNPPFSRALPLWVQKYYEESLKGICVVMLIPARTDTAYFQNYCFKGNILFIKGRLKFIDAERNTPKEKQTSAFFPSAVVVFGGGQLWILLKLNCKIWEFGND